jgi:hypothetical protein
MPYRRTIKISIDGKEHHINKVKREKLIAITYRLLSDNDWAKLDTISSYRDHSLCFQENASQLTNEDKNKLRNMVCEITKRAPGTKVPVRLLSLMFPGIKGNQCVTAVKDIIPKLIGEREDKYKNSRHQMLNIFGRYIQEHNIKKVSSTTVSKRDTSTKSYSEQKITKSIKMRATQEQICPPTIPGAAFTKLCPKQKKVDVLNFVQNGKINWNGSMKIPSYDINLEVNVPGFCLEQKNLFLKVFGDPNHVLSQLHEFKKRVLVFHVNPRSNERTMKRLSGIMLKNNEYLGYEHIEGKELLVILATKNIRTEYPKIDQFCQNKNSLIALLYNK